MLKFIMKSVGILLGILALLFVGLFVAISIFNSPTYAWRLLRYGKSDTQDYNIFPERAIAHATTFSPILRGNQATPYEVQYKYKGETRTKALNDLLKRTEARAFLIVKDDQLIS